MLNVIIVDDELAGRRTLREFCAAESDLNVVGEFGDGTAALAAIRELRPQLLFLDIQMDPLNGIDLARALPPDPDADVISVRLDHLDLRYVDDVQLAVELGEQPAARRAARARHESPAA